MPEKPFNNGFWLILEICLTWYVHHAFHLCLGWRYMTNLLQCSANQPRVRDVSKHPVGCSSQSILPHQLCGARIMFTRFCFPLPRKYVKWFGRPLVDSTTDIHTLYLIHAKKNIPVGNCVWIWNLTNSFSSPIVLVVLIANLFEVQCIWCGNAKVGESLYGDWFSFYFGKQISPASVSCESESDTVHFRECAKPLHNCGWFGVVTTRVWLQFSANHFSKRS